MHDLIIYQHIYKNGGSSIREGYMQCKRHKRLLDNGANIFMLDDNDNKIPFDMNCLLNGDRPVFFTGSVDELMRPSHLTKPIQLWFSLP